MKASPEAQLRLLELADLDAELGRLEHRRRSLPEHAELSELEQRDRELRDEIATVEAREGDLKREQAKADADVEQVRSRIARDRARLDAGQVNSPRELENLQSEIESLLRRQSDLEDVELDVMERLEAAQSRLKEAGAERAAAGTDLEAVTARRDVALAEISGLSSVAAERRAAVVAEEPADLIDLYERLRAQHGGVGAAALRRGQCQGCHLSLNTVDLNAIRAAAADDILRCEECRRILVRTDESGL
ncbi:MAG TPA: C4-type zinc ribbon domain-containing protein [Streptosporangiaceae bacterium]|nr:C4-type zinc ribbon domain-containing protein [Streptosporangiaceae bacterium]